MQYNVMISIRGEQEFAGAEKDATEFLTEGPLCETDYGFSLEYDESALTGMEGTHTAFQIRPQAVVLRRSGTFRSQMIFQPGKKHYSMYETPYGTMSLAIVTGEIKNDITAEGGTLEIRYDIEIEHQLAGESRFLIQVRPSGAQ